MNALFNKVVVTMLSKYLQYYMNEFSKESFKLQIMKGTFDLADIEINCQFLKDTVVLPNLEITDCLCNKLFLYIPWSNLSTEPITFDLDTINMTLVEIPPGEQPQFEVKNKRVKPSSYGFVQRTIDGIKMSVKQVNITLKLNGYRNNPSIAKIKTSDIKIYSCGSDWKPVDLKESFVADKKKSEVLFYKVLECGSLEVAFADLSPDRKNADEPPEYNVIMKDIPVKIRCKVLKDIHDGHVICGAFDLVLENMEMSFSDWQWKAFLELIKSLISCFTRTDQEYTFYRDVGNAFQDDSDGEEEDGHKREKKPATKAKSWWGGWTEGSKQKKESKEKEKAEREKLKRMDEWAIRSREREELLKAGHSPDELDLEETTFNIYIDKGCLNMLNDEDANCDDPAFHAFGRLHFEDMKAIFTLPPASDVPITNRWSDHDPKKKLLCVATLEMKHMALVLQERIEKKIKSADRKQIVLVTDGRSDSLKVKAAQHTQKKKKVLKKKERAAKEKKGDEPKGKRRTRTQRKGDDETPQKMTPFSLVNWEIVTHSPQELDMAKWLKSLDCQMKINVFESHLLVLHQWWARIERYLETASAGSKNIQALSLMKVTVALHVVGNYMTLPLTMSHKLVVPTMEEVLAQPFLMLHSTKVNMGKKALEKRTKALFEAIKIKEHFEGEAKDKMIVEQDKEKEGSKLRSGVTISGFGDHKDGWTDQELVRKPQRYEVLFENMSITINDRKILKPIDFEFEMVLHRYETIEQLLLELCVRAQVLQLHLSRSEYLMFMHFSEEVLSAVWMEIILVLQRRYGPDRFQKKLSDMSYHELAVSEGMMPIVVNTYGFVDYMVVTLTKDKTKHDGIFFVDEKEPPKDDNMLVELHFTDMKSKSYNTDLYKTGYYEKSVTCANLKILLPPEGGSKLEGARLEFAEPGEKEQSKIAVDELEGRICSSELPVVETVLKKNNAAALASLRAEDLQDAGHGIGAGSRFIRTNKFSVEVDEQKDAKHLPNVVVSLLNDLMNV